jgi:hypothetical protein
MKMKNFATPVAGEVNFLRTLRRAPSGKALQRTNRIEACSAAALTVHIRRERIGL